MACERQNLMVMRALLESKSRDTQPLGTNELVKVADLYVNDRAGGEPRGSKTGLHIAATHDYPEIAQLLIDHGCPLRIKDAEVSKVI